MRKCSICGQEMTLRELSRHRREQHPGETGPARYEGVQGRIEAGSERPSLSSQIAELEQQNAALLETLTKFENRAKHLEALVERAKAESKEAAPLLEMREKVDRVQLLARYSVQEKTQSPTQPLEFSGSFRWWDKIPYVTFTLRCLINQHWQEVKVGLSELPFFERVVAAMKEGQQREVEISAVINELRSVWSSFAWVESFMSVGKEPAKEPAAEVSSSSSQETPQLSQ